MTLRIFSFVYIFTILSSSVLATERQEGDNLDAPFPLPHPASMAVDHPDDGPSYASGIASPQRKEFFKRAPTLTPERLIQELAEMLIPYYDLSGSRWWSQMKLAIDIAAQVEGWRKADSHKTFTTLWEIRYVVDALFTLGIGIPPVKARDGSSHPRELTSDEQKFWHTDYNNEPNFSPVQTLLERYKVPIEIWAKYSAAAAIFSITCNCNDQDCIDRRNDYPPIRIKDPFGRGPRRQDLF